jgi:DegV family protein with EDD domain
MPKVAVVTDSAASLPPSVREQYGIEIVPLMLVLDGRSYPDSVDGNAKFYQALKASHRAPTTTSASPGAYLDAFRRAAAKAPSIVCLTVASRFSGTYNAASQGAEMLCQERPDVQVEIIDSESATMAEGYVAIEAARAAAAGADIEEVVTRAKETVPKVGIIALIDTLEYLARGGRVPRVAAWASALLSVKPIIELRNQDVRLITRMRTRQKAIGQLIPILEQRGLRGERLHLSVQHTEAPEDAERLAKEAADRLQPGELTVSEFTLVMGAHVGPRLLGFAYYFSDP